MLQQFCHAHATEDNPEPTLYFKKAGTLRYKREICYVVLICANTDLGKVEHLRKLTEKTGHVTLDGMLDENGIWNGVDCNFIYNKRSYPQAFKSKHLVFGFYFGPNSKVDHLVLEKGPYDTIPHSVTSCINKIQPRKYNWVCPDELENQPPENEQPENEPEDDSD